MITIDLLKGEGIPMQRGPGRVLLGLLPLMAPVLAGLFLASLYLGDRVSLHTQAGQLQKLESKTESMGSTRGFLEEANTRRKNLGENIREITQALPAHRQWSGVLLELVQNLPDAISLNKLEMQRQLMREQKKAQDGRPVEVIWYQYNLVIGTQCAAAAGDGAVQELVAKLRAAPAFAARIEDIQVINQERNSEKDRLATYEIACKFKRMNAQ